MTHRSYLFVPGDRPERFDKAVAAGANVSALDLEDAVRAEAKGRARAAIRDWLAQGGCAAVRVNGIGTEWHDDDVALLAAPGITHALLPKAEDPAALAAFIARLPAGRPVVLVVESALGLWNARDLAASLRHDPVDRRQPRPARRSDGQPLSAGRRVHGARTGGCPRSSSSIFTRTVTLAG